jgi:hypothetical protein
MIDKAIFNSAPLAPNAFAPLPTGAVKPRGYLLDIERTMAQGLTGNLVKVWDSLKDSAWLGGQGENWERGPYYLDGLIPLAWQLCDEELKGLARRFIEWALNSQQEDGFFGPKDNPDWWPRMVMLKCMTQFFTATGDKRVLSFMNRYFMYMARNLDERPLGLWAVARAGENIQAALWLYNITGQKALLKLCDKLLAQSMDWTGHFHTFPDARDQKRANPWKELEPQLKDNDDVWSAAWRQHQRTHVVNVAMGLKTPMLDHALHGGIKQAQAFKAGYTKLMRAHGVANGMFTGDEHLSGANPSQGTETCAVVETLYSIESLMALTEEAELGDIWERIAYNALPAALSADGWAHQYDQQVNQIRIDRRERGWYNNGPDANVFGLEPNFGCCTANLHQGWPKFTAHLFMATRDGGLAAQSYAPCEVTWRVGAARVNITVEGNYPADEEISLAVKLSQAAEFPLKLRIPAWAQDAYAQIGEETYPAQAGQYLTLHRMWQDGDCVRLVLPMEVRTEKWYHQTLAVYRGPLLYALPIEAKWDYRGELPLCDRYAEPVSKWNYALLPEYGLTADRTGTRITATAFLCEGWGEKMGSADQPPVRPLKGEAKKESITLVPYAAAPLRIAQFPYGREE